MKCKICTKCNQKKVLTKFNQDKKGKYGRKALCRDCDKLIKAIKRILFNEKINKQKRVWAKNNPDKITQYNRVADQKYPWKSTLRGIRSRLNDPSNISYASYGGKGVKNFLTVKDLEYLWFRDGAYLMKKPSIDRFHTDQDYTIDNCQYIELSENIAKRNRARKGIKK
jgi:hypothetical protein